LALALFGIVLALVPLGLDAIGYRLSTQQGYAILAIAGILFVAGVVVCFWPVVRAAWAWLRRDTQRDQLAARARTLEHERDDLQGQIAKLQGQVAPPPLSELKSLCLYLADELKGLERYYWQRDQSITLWKYDLEKEGLSEEEIADKQDAARAEVAREIWNDYHKTWQPKLLKLYDALEPRGWLGPAEKSRIENLEDLYYIRGLAKRLGEVCGKLSGDRENEIRTERLEEELRETTQERDELKRENKRLIEESENRPDPLPDTLAEWLDTTPLITVANRNFRNDRIELDGFHFDNCVFDACTFWFKGTKPFRVAASCQIKGDYGIDAPAPQALAILVFLKSLGALPPNFEYLDPHDGRPVD
jgi:hypothetical protein